MKFVSQHVVLRTAAICDLQPAGQTLERVLNSDPGYIEWMASNAVS